MKQAVENPVVQIVLLLLGIIVPSVIAVAIYLQSSQLTLEERSISTPLLFGKAMEGRVAMLIDGAPVGSLTVYYCTLTNTGRTPIRTADYEIPIRVTVKEPWRLHAIDMAQASPEDLQVTWKRVDTNTFEMEPTLLNSGDSIGIYLFLSDESVSEEPAELPQLRWTSRIYDVPALNVRPLEALLGAPGITLNIANVTYRSHGVGLLWLALIWIVMFYLAMRIGSIHRRFFNPEAPHKGPSPGQLFLLISVVVLSFLSSLFLADVLVEQNRPSVIVWLLLVPDLFLVFALVWPALRNKLDGLFKVR